MIICPVVITPHETVWLTMFRSSCMFEAAIFYQGQVATEIREGSGNFTFSGDLEPFTKYQICISVSSVFRIVAYGLISSF